MKIAVCLKAVPDTDTRIKIAADGRSIDRSEIKYIMSPYDEYALEEAIRTKEAKGGDVVVVGLGGDEVPAVLRDGLARGGDSAIHVSSNGVATEDPLAVGKALAAALKTVNADIIFFGKHGVGGDNQQVHTIVAELLGLPQATMVVKLQINDRNVRCEREIEGGLEVIETTLPVVIGANKGMNEPRYPKLPAIMQAKKKPFATKTIADLGLSAADVSEAASATYVTGMYLPPARQARRKLEGDVNEQVTGLIQALQGEAKVL